MKAERKVYEQVLTEFNKDVFGGEGLTDFQKSWLNQKFEGEKRAVFDDILMAVRGYIVFRWDGAEYTLPFVDSYIKKFLEGKGESVSLVKIVNEKSNVIYYKPVAAEQWKVRYTRGVLEAEIGHPFSTRKIWVGLCVQ